MSLKKKMEPGPQSLLYSTQRVWLSLDPWNTPHGLETWPPTGGGCDQVPSAGFPWLKAMKSWTGACERIPLPYFTKLWWLQAHAKQHKRFHSTDKGDRSMAIFIEILKVTQPVRSQILGLWESALDCSALCMRSQDLVTVGEFEGHQGPRVPADPAGQCRSPLSQGRMEMEARRGLSQIYSYLTLHLLGHTLLLSAQSYLLAWFVPALFPYTHVLWSTAECFPCARHGAFGWQRGVSGAVWPKAPALERGSQGGGYIPRADFTHRL